MQSSWSLNLIVGFTVDLLCSYYFLSIIRCDSDKNEVLPIISFSEEISVTGLFRNDSLII